MGSPDIQREGLAKCGESTDDTMFAKLVSLVEAEEMGKRSQGLLGFAGSGGLNQITDYKNWSNGAKLDRAITAGQSQSIQSAYGHYGSLCKTVLDWSASVAFQDVENKPPVQPAALTMALAVLEFLGCWYGILQKLGDKLARPRPSVNESRCYPLRESATVSALQPSSTESRCHPFREYMTQCT